jgi:cell division protein FtsL
MLGRLGICVGVLSLCLYSYLSAQNALTQVKIAIPQIEKEIQTIQEENRRFASQISQFESPSHLIELAHRPEYSHLKHPVLKEILTVPEAWASN